MNLKEGTKWRQCEYLDRRLNLNHRSIFSAMSLKHSSMSTRSDSAWLSLCRIHSAESLNQPPALWHTMNSAPLTHAMLEYNFCSLVTQSRPGAPTAPCILFPCNTSRNTSVHSSTFKKLPLRSYISDLVLLQAFLADSTQQIPH